MFPEMVPLTLKEMSVPCLLLDLPKSRCWVIEQLGYETACSPKSVSAHYDLWTKCCLFW